MKKRKRANNATDIVLWSILGCIIVFMVAFTAQDYKKRGNEKRQEKARQEQRGKDFANYIINDVREWVPQNMNNQDIEYAAREYKANPQQYDNTMKSLVKDSTKYAKAIFRDAGVINKLDDLEQRTISFEEAMQYVNSQPAEYFVPRQKTVLDVECDGFGNPVVSSEYVKTGDTISIPNKCPARIIKINKRHLRNLSLELATRRAGMYRQ